MKPNSAWKLVTLQVDRDGEEGSSVLLFEMGSTGIVTLEEHDNYSKLGAYFDSDKDAQELRLEVEAQLAKAGLGRNVLALSVETILDQDWMKKWKEGLIPIEAGTRLVVAPSWNLPDQVDGRVVIQIDPGMAFGTGTHETIRLCLEAIERYWHGGSFLDIGTGTGILAIAAALLEPGSRVTAIDVDPKAVEVARENVEINRVSGSIEVSVAQPRDLQGRTFDLLVANLTAEVLVDLMSDLSGLLSTEGLMIISGILTELSGEVERALAASDLVVIERMEAGEWCAFAARKV